MAGVGRELLVVYKPEGSRRTCTPGDVTRTLTAWSSLLDWLCGADPDELPESGLIGSVARKAALRTPRFGEYDVRRWAEQARDLDRPTGVSGCALITLPDLAAALLEGIRLHRTHRQRCWLNRVAIELLYRQAQSFQRHRDVLVSRLLNGPVVIERWSGHRYELALAAKLLLRHTLSIQLAGNLIHMEITSSANAANIQKAVALPAAVWPSADT